MTNDGEPVILPQALEHFRGHAVARALSSVAELPATLAGLQAAGRMPRLQAFVALRHHEFSLLWARLEVGRR